MPSLIIKYPDRAPDVVHLGRLRITIGRSARNDVCLPDPFASRVHAEVRREGDQYVLQDLGSANGTLYNGERLEAAVALLPGSRFKIGETELEYQEFAGADNLSATMIADNGGSMPRATISLSSGNRTTSGLLEAIEGARTQPDTKQRAAGLVEQSDLLALISKVGVTLLSSATLDETLKQVAALVFEAVPADRCLIMLREEQDDELKPRVARLRSGKSEDNVGGIRISRAIIEEVVGQGKSVLASDAQHDPRFASSTMTIQGIRSVLAVPLGVGEQNFGIIYADSPMAEARFGEDHLQVLTTLASVAAIRVQNARLIEDQISRERLEQELQLAREIQQRFQPTAPPHVPGYELQGISFPNYQIGGDYYDFIVRGDGRIVLALGDVSGKGTSAALLMSSLHAAIHGQVSSHHSLAETIEAVNRYLADNIPSNRFVTLFYAELDPATGALSFLNAGHNPPLLLHAGDSVEHLQAGGLPLGIDPNASFREGRTQLQPGDVLVAYSDGVTETTNPAGEEFGAVRLYEVVARNMHASAASIRDRIESALTKFAQGEPAADDITLLIAKRNKQAGP